MSFNRDLGIAALPDGSGITLAPGPAHEVMAGTVHFAVLTTLAEVAAAQAAATSVVPTHVAVQLMRRATSDRPLIAHGRVLKAGRTLVFAEGEVRQDGELVAKATVTFARV